MAHAGVTNTSVNAHASLRVTISQAAENFAGGAEYVRAMSATYKALTKIVNNGCFEAGLEAGVDAGLPESLYTLVPAGMSSTMDVNIAINDIADVTLKAKLSLGAAHGVATVRLPSADFKTLVLVNDRYYVRPVASDIQADGTQPALCARDIKVVPVNVTFATTEGLFNFVAMNLPWITQYVNDLPGTTLDRPMCVEYIMRTRMWMWALGCLASYHSNEYTVAPALDENALTAEVEAMMLRIRTVDSGHKAMTAIVLRCINWRKTGHATGGKSPPAVLLKYLDKEGMGGKDSIDALVSMFHTATHPASVHTVLALMMHGDPSHFSLIDTTHGVPYPVELRASMSLRTRNIEHVHGASLVVDAAVVLECMLHDRTMHLLNNQDQVDKLLSQLAIVRSNGIRVCTSARWFLSYHPLGVVPQPFDQKDGGCYALCQELAVVASTYYKRHSIGQSKALANAAAEVTDKNIRDLWSALGKDRSSGQAVSALAVLMHTKGNQRGVNVENLFSPDPNVVSDAADVINASYADVYNRIKTIGDARAAPSLDFTGFAGEKAVLLQRAQDMLSASGSLP